MLLNFSISAQTERDIPIALKVGNSKEIAKFFAPNVNLKILDNEDIYSKTQAELILKDFLGKNLVKSYTQKHNGVSKNGAEYYIGELKTMNGNFRVYYFFKKNGSDIVLQEFRIENEE